LYRKRGGLFIPSDEATKTWDITPRFCCLYVFNLTNLNKSLFIVPACFTVKLCTVVQALEKFVQTLLKIPINGASL
jgi:hypothetical protein